MNLSLSSENQKTNKWQLQLGFTSVILILVVCWGRPQEDGPWPEMVSMFCKFRLSTIVVTRRCFSFHWIMWKEWPHGTLKIKSILQHVISWHFHIRPSVPDGSSTAHCPQWKTSTWELACTCFFTCVLATNSARMFTWQSPIVERHDGSCRENISGFNCAHTAECWMSKWLTLYWNFRKLK